MDWDNLMAQLCGLEWSFGTAVTLLVTQTIESERLVAVQSNRWIYWTKSIFLKMERVLPSGSMGCNLVVTSSDNQVPPSPSSSSSLFNHLWEDPSPLRGPISPFSAVSRETFTPSVPDSMGLNLLSQFLYQMFYFLSLLSGWFVCYFRPDFCRHLRRQK